MSTTELRLISNDFAGVETRGSAQGPVGFYVPGAHRVARDQPHDPFGDVGGPVRDPFQVMGNPQQVRRPLDVARVLEHVGQQLPVDLVVQIVYRVVVLADLARLPFVPVGVRLQACLLYTSPSPRDS